MCNSQQSFILASVCVNWSALLLTIIITFHSNAVTLIDLHHEVFLKTNAMGKKFSWPGCRMEYCNKKHSRELVIVKLNHAEKPFLGDNFLKSFVRPI